MTIDSAEGLLTGREIRRRLGISEWTLRRMIGEGMPMIRLGYNVYRYRWADVSRWVEQYNAASQPDVAKEEEKDA